MMRRSTISSPKGRHAEDRAVWMSYLAVDPVSAESSFHP